ncbi:hypothetical protein MIND_00874200 [Mycena indigotica]|uniref:DUF6534 domain-containing protein n=1 Tax=Mycena indigotica TaxID=2126181 RepID=A0A8H6SGN0_9AGAR|nr:uncharacterized protein MIND_00874200 [Mycena indigotica]KAF7299255.1 hypothetical protein MIND_00874200 [Mycena indigotica]
MLLIASPFYTAPVFVGMQFNWLLLGLLLVQVYYFYHAFPNERWGIKALVYTLLLIDLVETGIGSWATYEMLVKNWGNSQVFFHVTWAAFVQPFTAGLTSTIVQLFFVWRILKLKGSVLIVRLICLLISLISLAQGLCAMVNSIRLGQALARTSDLDGAAGQLNTKIWLGGAVAADMLIAITMSIILAAQRRSVPWAKTDSLITTLIIHAVETGSITTIAAVLQLALFLSHPENFMHNAPLLILTKLYSNIVLATLNWRAERKHHVFSESSNPSTGVNVAGQSFGLKRMPASGDRSKTVTVEVHHGSETDLEQKRPGIDF